MVLCFAGEISSPVLVRKKIHWPSTILVVVLWLASAVGLGIYVFVYSAPALTTTDQTLDPRRCIPTQLVSQYDYPLYGAPQGNGIRGFRLVTSYGQDSLSWYHGGIPGIPNMQLITCPNGTAGYNCCWHSDGVKNERTQFTNPFDVWYILGGPGTGGIPVCTQDFIQSLLIDIQGEIINQQIYVACVSSNGFVGYIGYLGTSASILSYIWYHYNEYVVASVDQLSSKANTAT